jgi:hypothetical protein
MPSYSEKNLYERIIDRQGRLESIRAPWDSPTSSIADLTRHDLTSDIDEKGVFVGSKVKEGTPAHAARIMTHGLIGNMVSAKTAWIKYGMPETFLRGDDEINHWLNEVEEHMYSVYEASNLYGTLPRFGLDGVTVGSPVMIIEEDEGEGIIHCVVPHYTERYLFQDMYGNDVGLHLKKKMSVLKLVERFGKDECGASVKRDLENGNHWKEYKILQVIYRADDEIFTDLTDLEDKKYKPNNPWVQYYVMVKVEGMEKNENILQMKPYRVKPFTAWHFERNEHESYARTPSWYAYYDILGGQAIHLTRLEIYEKAARPPKIAMRYLKNRLRLAPQGITWVDSKEDLDAVRGLDEKMNLIASKELAAEYDEKIKRWYHYRLFMMLHQMQMDDKSPPTAFQIFHTLGEKGVLIGPAVYSVESDILKPIDDRFLEIEDFAGRLPEPPDKFFEMSKDRIIKPTFVGPLSQSQRLYLTHRKVLENITAIAPILEIAPEVRYKYRWDVMAEKLSEQGGLWQECIVPKDEYKEFIAELAREEAEERQLDQAERIAKAIPSVSKSVEKDSPLAALTGGAA